jgi:hypothetical protein
MTVSGHQCKSPPHIIHDQGGFWIFHSIAWRLAAKLVVHRGGDVFQLQSRLTFEANIPCPIQFLMYHFVRIGQPTAIVPAQVISGTMRGIGQF